MSLLQNDDLIKRLMALGLALSDGLLRGTSLVANNLAASGTVQSTVYTLGSVALPANALRDAKSLRIRAALTTAANANAKDIKIMLGATAICTVTGNTANAKDVIIDVVVQRLGAASQVASAIVHVDGALVAASSILAAATEVESSALTVALTAANTAAAAASGTGKQLVVTLG